MISNFFLFLLVVGSAIGDPNEPEFSNLEEDSRNDLLSEDAIEDQAFDLLFEELESDSERRWSFPRIARINFVPITGTSVRGSLKFYQFKDGLFIRGKLYGLAEGFHGLHVHENGNADANCTLTGLHFNPDNVTHGGPNAAVHHAGDLGNVATSPSGKTKVRILNRQLSLDPNSRYYIVGRSMAVHINADDLGLGGTAASLTVGSSGLRVGCGIIIASYHH